MRYAAGHLHKPAATDLRRSLNRLRDLPHCELGALQFPEHRARGEDYTGSHCESRGGHLETYAEGYMDFRNPTYTRTREALRFLQCNFSRRGSAAERRDSHRARDHFRFTPLAILQPRTAIAWQAAARTVVRSGFGLFSDLLPGSIVDLIVCSAPIPQSAKAMWLISIFSFRCHLRK